MSHGVEPELVACQLHAARHAKRLAQLGTRLREKPVQRMPRAGHGWAATVAA
jgi:Transposase DNA-binding